MTAPEPVDFAAVDLFCGAGGLTYGLQQAGINVALGIDIEPTCKYPYEHNNDTELWLTSVENVTGADIKAAWGEAPIRILAGCPPCQPFSSYSRTGSKHGEAHEDYALMLEFARLIEESNPDIVIMENVTGMARTPLYDVFRRAVGNRHLCDGVYNAVDYGLPQSRRRLLAIASHLGVPFMPLEGSFGRKTVRQAIAHLPPIEAGEAHPDDPLHVSARLLGKNPERIRASKPGGTWEDWPEHLWLDCHTRPTGHKTRSTWGRMEWDKPAPTLTTQFTGFGNGRYGHPEQHRAISLREGAILQGFPDGYEFARGEVSISTVRTLIGNSVPTVFGEVFGRVIRDHLHTDYGLDPQEALFA